MVRPRFPLVWKTTIVKTNLEAVKEIVPPDSPREPRRHHVSDFIDMKSAANPRTGDGRAGPRSARGPRAARRLFLSTNSDWWP